MSEKQVFEYAFIRLVPKVEREEFLNVGVILFCKRKKYLRVKYHLPPDKIAAFAPSLDRQEIEEYLKTWGLISSANPEGGPVARLDQASRFRWLTATRSTVIQSSKVHPGLCDNPHKLMEDLFAKYVL